MNLIHLHDWALLSRREVGHFLGLTRSFALPDDVQLLAELSNLIAEHRVAQFPSRWDDDNWMEALLELAEYDGWVMGLASRVVAGQSMPPPMPPGKSLSDSLRKMHSMQGPNKELERGAIDYAQRLDAMLTLVRRLG